MVSGGERTEEGERDEAKEVGTTAIAREAW